MDELDDLDTTIVQVLRESNIPQDQYSLAANNAIKQKLNMPEYDKWWSILGRLRRLEAKDYVAYNVETNRYSYK